jgi:hypothetical protein
MSNPVLVIKDAGHGETPSCEIALFTPGAVVRWKRVAGYIVAVAIPPGFPAEYALADLTKTARPLMITKPSRVVTYILVREGDPKPYLATERDLKPTGEHVEIGSVLYAEDAAA